MGKAFQCDLCEDLCAGEPVTTVQVKGVNGVEDWCDQCLASYTDWREAMKPRKDAPEDEPPYTSSYA